jgi:hypothetical protein
MNKDDIIKKIRKCLALATSSNEHEAAAALRQAKKLMAAHAVSEAELAAAGVGEQEAKSGAQMRPAAWESFLAAVVADSFHCQALLIRTLVDKAKWKFIGVGADPEVAVYAFMVLLRQVKRARAQHMRTRLARCVKTKIQRADLFAMGFINRLAALVEAFADKNPHEAAIAAYQSRQYPASVKMESLAGKRAGKPRSSRDWSDFMAGEREGGNAQLFRAAGQAGNPAGLLQ